MTKINTRKSLAETKDYSAEDAKYMQMAIDLSVDNVDNGGGPFGAVIVKDGEVLASGVNRVVPNKDPTATLRFRPSVRHAAASRLINLRDVRSTAHVSRVRCVSALYIGQASSGSVTATPRLTPKR